MANKPTKIMLVAGARPNFVKIAALLRVARSCSEFAPRLIHTGQHYDFLMSDVFFRNLGIPEPDSFLNVGSDSHARQTAKIMMAFEEVVSEDRPDLVMVVGDVNSTLACALVAAKLGIPVAHVEAGLRSRDWSMPEEINRVLTDRLSSYLFVSERSGVENLIDEGIQTERIHFVGNVMIDTLIDQAYAIAASSARRDMGLERKSYAVVTLHRPSNVDDRANLERMIELLRDFAARIPVVYPVHPRTRAVLEKNGLLPALRHVRGLTLTEPMGYIDFLSLVKEARVVATDSGGLQEETTYLGVPCLTLRDSTERPVTLEEGTNRLIGTERSEALSALEAVLRQPPATSGPPDLWDGHAAERIFAVLTRDRYRIAEEGRHLPEYLEPLRVMQAE